MIYLKLFLTFFQIGLFTIGGGYAMIPMMQAEVAKNGWLSANDLVDFIAVSESTPGPFAINAATYIGVETGGFWGSVCATLGVVLPSFLIILLVARCYQAFSQSRLVQGALFGMRPTVIGLIAAAGCSIAIKNLYLSGGELNLTGLLIFFLVLALSLWKKPHPILLIAISAGLGVAFCWAKEQFFL